MAMNDFVTNEIVRFVQGYRQLKNTRTRWQEPLVAFADASDPLFGELKTAVSPTHAMPGDMLSGARSVVTYFIPFEKDIPRENRGGRYAARQWADAYMETNRLIMALNDHLSAVLAQKGVRTSVLPPTHNFDKVKLISDWSHRHAAFIAGLGTFGLHNLLITDRGCCGRLGSIITDAQFRPGKRPVKEYCLYKNNGTCMACVKNCVAGALKEDSFDRQACYKLLLENDEIFDASGKADVCGKCTCVVPCSFANPVKTSINTATENEKTI